ncbi:MAG: prolyl oligopeptidase family serine peptidase [Motilibacteraceae bacterium]
MTDTSSSAGVPELPYPRHSARTQRFTLGAPRSFSLSPDGARLVFVRTGSGTDRVGRLHVLEVATGDERVAADPATLLSSGEEDLSPAERARRERLREGGAGIVGYATDRDATVAAFALSSRLFVADLMGSGARELPAAGAVLDPRPDPTGTRVAYAAGGALHVVDADGTNARVLAEPDGENVSYGLAEFVASEEMGRYRGYWWAPDGQSLLVARVDESPVQTWWIADPEHPDRAPAAVRYPAAGTPNADVRLLHITLDGERTEVAWDRETYPYLVEVTWSADGAPLLAVQSRDQRRLAVLAADLAAGTTEVLVEDTDPVWVEVRPGAPRWTPDGRMLRVVDRDDTLRLALGAGTDEVLLTPPGLQVTAVVDVDADGALVLGSEEPTEQHVLRVGWDGAVQRLTDEPGVHSGRTAGGAVLLVSATLEQHGSRARLLREGSEPLVVRSLAERPALVPAVTLLRAGERELRTGVLFPTGWAPGSGRLPVLVDPYGGPHHLEVVAARGIWYEPQWWADQGFAVVVADGRGTPGRGPAWERAVSRDFAGPVLEDQVDALHAAAERFGDLDLSKVAIRGWSFGGWLAALAVLRRPDVFAAGIAGAPVTDWALYDTHYTERYLGTPAGDPQAYAANSLVADAAKLSRPLMLIHGLSDDNVVVSHSLSLSSALLAAGRPHTVLPLSGVTHMTPQEVVAENLLLLQLRFLREALGLDAVNTGASDASSEPSARA